VLRAAARDEFRSGVGVNILFCIKSIANPGGAERVLADVASGLCGRCHRVGVLSFDTPGGQSRYELAPGVEWIALGIGDTRSRARVAETLARIRALRSHVHAWSPDIAVGFMHSMFVPLGVALAGSSVPLVASEHIVPAHYRNRPIQALLLGCTPWFSRVIVVVSEQARQAYPKWLRSHMCVINNPVSVAPGAVRADPVGPVNGRRRLLTVGRLAEQKDHATLIEAFAEVAERFPEWELRIVGDGPLREEIRGRVEKLGLADRVTLAGSVSDIGDEYVKAQLFVLPSRYESLGLALVEALAHGLPAMGFKDCEGVNRLIEPEKNGCLVEGAGNRVAALANGLERLMGNDEKRAALVRRDWNVPDQYCVGQVIDRWEEVLNNVTR